MGDILGTKRMLVNTQLFKGINVEELPHLLQCLNAREKKYKKGDIIFLEGHCLSDIGVVLDGSVFIEFCDAWGNNNIIRTIGAGGAFGEEYACGAKLPLVVSVKAATDTSILFLSASRVLRTCTRACECHEKVISNLLYVSVTRSLNLFRRIVHSSPKSIRGRLVSYFSECIKRSGSYSFDIPFNRQQLADYLNADRSALSNELSKMRDEGLLTYKKNHFEIHELPDDF